MQARVQAAPVIDGLYCGSAISGGQLVEVRTRLTTRANGMLEGVYDFADQGDTTSGTLREYSIGSELNRSLVWVDKYGTGRLDVTFTQSGDSFDGNWGVDSTMPSFRWDGKKCSAETVEAPSVHPDRNEAQFAGL